MVHGLALHLQRSIGNRAVQAMLPLGRPREPRPSVAGPPAAPVPRPYASTPVVQRTGPVDDAIASRDATSVDALTAADIARASPSQRVELISIDLEAGSGDALPRLWDSFGEGWTRRWSAILTSGRRA